MRIARRGPVLATAAMLAAVASARAETAMLAPIFGIYEVVSARCTGYAGAHDPCEELSFLEMAAPGFGTVEDRPALVYWRISDDGTPPLHEAHAIHDVAIDQQGRIVLWDWKLADERESATIAADASWFVWELDFVEPSRGDKAMRLDLRPADDAARASLTSARP